MHIWFRRGQLVGRTDVALQLSPLLNLRPANGQVLKIATLADGEDVDYCELLVDPDADDAAPHWTGRVIMLTRTRVIDARLKVGPSAGRTTAAVWSRQTLKGIDLSGNDELWEDATTGIPTGAQVALHYPHRDPLRLPLDPTAEKYARQLEKILPSLFENLSR